MKIYPPIAVYGFSRITVPADKCGFALCEYLRQNPLLAPFNISRYYTDDWGAYERHLDADKHEVGKQSTQKIERKNLNFRTWIKRLARRTLCFSKLELMHDIVIGLLINKVEFGRDIHG